MPLTKPCNNTYLSHDRTAEKIFSNDISTWKNLGNSEFIDRVGDCFAAINTIEEYWNGMADDVEALVKKITTHPNEYEGATTGAKLIRNKEMRVYIANVHNSRGWLKYTAASLRQNNRYNMRAIGISEEEVMEFTDSRNWEDVSNEDAPKSDDFYTPALKPDSATGLWKDINEILLKQ